MDAKAVQLDFTCLLELQNWLIHDRKCFQNYIKQALVICLKEKSNELKFKTLCYIKSRVKH